MKIQFLHESVCNFLASGRLRDEWASGQLHFEEHCGVQWEETIIFAAEQCGSVDPLLETLSDSLTENYPRRRAAEVLARVGRPQDISRILRTLSGDDHWIYVLVGFALRSLLSLPDAEDHRQQVRSLLQQWSQADAPLSDKLQAARVIDRLGLTVGHEVVETLLAALQDDHPLVRAAFLTALAECALPPRISLLRPCCFDIDQAVRERSMAALLYPLSRKRSYHLWEDTRHLLTEFSNQYSEPTDQYTLTYWIGSLGTRRYDTQHLISVLCDQAQHELVQISAARHLCCHPPQAYLTANDWAVLQGASLSKEVEDILRVG